MLYVVATPIGNLGDLSDRAKTVLRTVPIIACEDTRHSQIILKSVGSAARLLSFHAHSGTAKLTYLIDLLKIGSDIALITDAGTPGISDPGGMLVEQAHVHQIPVRVIPGPSSVTAALSVCGFSADQFIFFGYLPKKKGRQTLVKRIAIEPFTCVLFESPHRIVQTLQTLHDGIGEARRICICREMTKQFEDIRVCTLSEALASPPKALGEFVLVIEGLSD